MGQRHFRTTPPSFKTLCHPPPSCLRLKVTSWESGWTASRTRLAQNSAHFSSFMCLKLKCSAYRHSLSVSSPRLIFFRFPRRPTSDVGSRDWNGEDDFFCLTYGKHGANAQELDDAGLRQAARQGGVEAGRGRGRVHSRTASIAPFLLPGDARTASSSREDDFTSFCSPAERHRRVSLQTEQQHLEKTATGFKRSDYAACGDLQRG
ncbi:hypothetical protein BDZ89DRAFT_570800 [Hymenopellis radicata]|nr:hypothetical protein BDZ89DRAFT_570800 [Hymenopellis radicata]